MKYVVIFKATILELDDEYHETAQKLRNKALNEYNCQKFESYCENNTEIALSYWNSIEDIQTWHLNLEHQAAQKLGKTKWYKDFSVKSCELHINHDSKNKKSEH